MWLAQALHSTTIGSYVRYAYETLPLSYLKILLRGVPDSKHVESQRGNSEKYRTLSADPVLLSVLAAKRKHMTLEREPGPAARSVYAPWERRTFELERRCNVGRRKAAEQSRTVHPFVLFFSYSRAIMDG
ncbi:hypothetical protein R1flu_001572 [Riccia fluitans]|uniref:Uncharacterized protein n=1 Tax=Riccia fluitans TaxID=41844 RepID=A0ABD1Y6M2_9MARC